MLFCPSCANVLLVEYGSGNLLRFCCQTCPYIFNITSKVTRKMVLKRKEVDQVIEDKSWDSVDQTEVKCEKCGNNKAYFLQIQIRSADEPMTIFYRCTNKECDHKWREG